MSVVEVSERFVEGSAPDDEDAYPIDHDVVDLAPLARDAILLDLPLAPLCRADCAGLCPYCGTDRNEETLRLLGARPTRAGLHWTDSDSRSTRETRMTGPARTRK